MSQLDYILSVYDTNPVKPRAGATPLPQKGFLASAYELAEKANASLDESQHIKTDTVDAILERTKDMSEGARLRAVTQFVNTVENPNTNTPTTHRDLLPRNHPLSAQWVSRFTVRKETAKYYENHPKIEDHEIRTLIASAIAAEPESLERKFFTEALLAKTNDFETLGVIREADNAIADKLAKK